ncbi:hypothetical protein RDI58_024202 [Solanum bulbocastanum]|uniref:BHLH domain-containing protein n=1 Tax=Solanum bulbocastanum TaxID=147425 RepID=A0AAN8SX86_SOLBU
MGESKVMKSAEIPRQPRQELNTQAIVDTIAEVKAATALAEAIIADIEMLLQWRRKHYAEIGEKSSNAASTVSDADQKGKKKGLPAKNLMAERCRRKKLNDKIYMLRSVVPKITKV